jgi:DNA-directed RNA polymerase subunit E'/Rpb7
MTSLNIKSKYSKLVKEGETRDDIIYSKSLISQRVILKIVHIGNNIKQTLEKSISAQIEGKCIIDGYVKPNSVSVLTYSSGIVRSSDIEFQVVFECLVCSPVEGMIISCIAKNITKAGIRAEINEDPSPMVIFIARDHHYKSNYFSNVKENDTIRIKVIGQRYELNDKYVSVIAELMTIPNAIIVPNTQVPNTQVPSASAIMPNTQVPSAIMPNTQVPMPMSSIAELPPAIPLKRRTQKNVGPKKKLTIID